MESLGYKDYTEHIPVPGNRLHLVSHTVHGKFWKSNIAISVKISEVDLSRAPKWIVFPPSRVQAGNCSRFVVGSES